MLLGRKRIPRSFEHASRARNASEPHRRGAPPASLTRRPQAEGFERPQPKAAVPSPVPPSLQAASLAPSALNTHCRTEPEAPARNRDVFPKHLPGGDGSKTAKTFKKTPEGDPSSKSSFAFLPCLCPGTRAIFAAQSGRPEGRTAESLGDQPCPNSGTRQSRWLASSSPTAATRSQKSAGSQKWKRRRHCGKLR